jgi:hypothetical protein
MRILKLFIVMTGLAILCAAPSFASDAEDGAVFARKLELARQVQERYPVRPQLDSAIEYYIRRFPAQQREAYRAALHRVLNYRALEKISLDAYIEVYNAEELQAILEAKEDENPAVFIEKRDEYAALVTPEIVRMLDRALMRARTGGAGDL